MPGPLYHNGPVVWSCAALLAGAHLVVLPRFDAEATLAAIEEHSVDVVYLVPTMMKRIWRLPIEVRERYDLSSLRFVWHLAEPCPPWLKEAWIEWLGRRADLGALRRHRGAGRHHHHGRRVARAPRVGRQARRGHRAHHRRRRQRGARRASRARCGCGPSTRDDAELPLRRRRGPHARRAAGSRSATSAGSTPTASSTSATGSPT